MELSTVSVNKFGTRTRIKKVVLEGISSGTELDAEISIINRSAYNTLPNVAGGRWIRLLELLPGDDATDIACRLQTVQLSEDGQGPSYEALSYCWGSTLELCTLDLDGRKIVIRASLYSALLFLRSPNEVRTLWVDAICIDQADLKEKNTQVAMMATIYNQAAKVIVWLGDPTPESHLAFKLITRLAELHGEGLEAHLLRADRSELVSGLGFSAVMKSPLWLRVEPSCDALINLLQRPWFERMWVVQEFHCAKNRLMVCGSDSLSWKVFATGSRFAQSLEIFNTWESPTQLA